MNAYTAFFLALALAGAAGIAHTWLTDRRDARRRRDARQMVDHLRRYP